MTGHDALQGYLLANVLSYLTWTEVLRARIVGRSWKASVLLTQVEELPVQTACFARRLPHLSNLMPRVRTLTYHHACAIRDDLRRDVPTDLFVGVGCFHEIEILSARCLRIPRAEPIIMSLQNLRSLDLFLATELVWDLSHLEALKHLEELRAGKNKRLTGRSEHLQAIGRTLRVCDLTGCIQVTGELQDLASLPVLKVLMIDGTQITGDIRDIRPSDFQVLDKLSLGRHVFGGNNLALISDAPVAVGARRELERRRSSGLFLSSRLRLALNSVDRYPFFGDRTKEPPFSVEIVSIGARKGWRWTNGNAGGACDIHWLDDEPAPADSHFEQYQRAFRNIRRSQELYRGLLSPPTQDEHREICHRDASQPVSSVARVGW